MASITLEVANTGEKIPVNDLDLEAVTNEELVEAAITNDILKKPEAGMEYKLIGKSNAPIIDKANLSSLGFVDGDTIKIVAKPVGA